MLGLRLLLLLVFLLGFLLALLLALLACSTKVTGDAASAPALAGAMERFVAALAQPPAPGAPKRAFEAALGSAGGTAAEALKALATRATW